MDYDLTPFASYKAVLTTHDAVCFLAPKLYLERMRHHGSLPRGAKSGFAKQLSLQHPDWSHKTAQNLVSIAWKCQDYCDSLLQTYRNAFAALDDDAFVRASAKAVSEKLTKELQREGRDLHASAIGEYLAIVWPF